MIVKGLLPHQKEFAQSKHRNTAIVGGFRSGKTRAILYKYIELSLLRKGKVKLLLIAPTYRLLSDVDIPLFTEYLEKKNIKYTFQKQDMRIIIHEYIKGEIMFRSGDNPTRIVGFESTDFIIDEFDTIRYANQPELWQKALARISGAENGTASIVTTPEGYKYTYELFVAKKVGKLIKAKTTDNHYLPSSYVKSLFENYDATLIKQYIEGEFVNINQMLFCYAFTRDNIKDLDAKFEAIPSVIGNDFNINPFAGVVIQSNGEEVYVRDEIHLKTASTDYFCSYIKNKYKDVQILYPDSTGGSRSTSSLKSNFDIMEQYGYSIRYARDNSFRNRQNCINRLFCNGKGIRRAFIHPRCKNLIRDIEQVGVDNEGKMDKKNPTLTHWLDAFCNWATYEEPIQWMPNG